MNSIRRNSIRLAAAASLLVLVLGAAFPAAANHGGIHIVPEQCRLPSNIARTCTLCHIAVMTVNFTNFLMKNIAFPAAVLLITIGGLTLLTAGPSEGRRTTGKKTITTTIVGLIIVMLAWIAVDTIIKVLTGADLIGPPGNLFKNLSVTFGPWNEIDPTNCPL